MGTPDELKPRRMGEKWKRIIQPDGDSDSSIDCWDDEVKGISGRSNSSQALTAVRLKHYLVGTGNSRSIMLDNREQSGSPGPSSNLNDNNNPHPGPSNSPNIDNGIMNLTSPLQLRNSGTSTQLENPTPQAASTSSKRISLGRLISRSRRGYFQEVAPLSFENRIKIVKDRLRQRQQQLLRNEAFRNGNNEPYHNQRSSPSHVLSSSLASLRSMMRCGNNPDWLKLSNSQSVEKLPNNPWYREVHQLADTAVAGPSTSSFNTEQWRPMAPPQEIATNLSAPSTRNDNLNPSGNENPAIASIEPELTNSPASPDQVQLQAEEQMVDAAAGPNQEAGGPGNSAEASNPLQVIDQSDEVAVVEEHLAQPDTKLPDLALNSSILSMLECPVCLEHMGPPIQQCKRGHLVCNNCRSQLASCPTCRARFIDLRNLALERVAELLHFPCKNDECGLSFQLHCREQHELNCRWRMYNCMAHNCQWQGLHKGMLAHMMEHHAPLILIGNTHVLEIPLDMPTFSRNYIFCEWGELFRANVQRAPGSNMIYSLTQYLGPVAHASDFKFTYKLEQPNSNGVERISMYQRTTHDDNIRFSRAYNDGDCFIVNADQAKYFASGRMTSLMLIIEKVSIAE